MITGVAFVPQAPALVPEIGRGLDAELGPARTACRDAIGLVTAAGAIPELVAGPDAVGVGEWLISTAAGSRTGPDTALVVVADGSARRSEKAPGYLDERAEPFDRIVAAALGSGDPTRLTALDADLGRELLAAGVPTWHAAAALLDGTAWNAELLYDDAPFGVGYFVAVWTPPGAPGA